MREHRAIPMLSLEAERLLRWFRHHSGDLEGEELLQAALLEIPGPFDQADFGRCLLELHREGYITFRVQEAPSE